MVKQTWHFFLPDKPSSVPEPNPNSEDEFKSEDTSVVKRAENIVFVKNGWENLTDISERLIPWTANFAVNTHDMRGTQNMHVMLALHS